MRLGQRNGISLIVIIRVSIFDQIKRNEPIFRVFKEREKEKNDYERANESLKADPTNDG